MLRGHVTVTRFALHKDYLKYNCRPQRNRILKSSRYISIIPSIIKPLASIQQSRWEVDIQGRRPGTSVLSIDVVRVLNSAQ
jgi:hypothetical protein